MGGLIFVIFVAVFYFLPFFSVPIVLFHFSCLFWFSLSILHDSTYQLYFIKKFSGFPGIYNSHLQLIQVYFQKTCTIPWVVQVPYNNKIILLSPFQLWIISVISFIYTKAYLSILSIYWYLSIYLSIIYHQFISYLCRHFHFEKNPLPIINSE